MKSQFADMTWFLIFFKISIFLLPSLSAGPSFMSISWLLLELLGLIKEKRKETVFSIYIRTYVFEIY